MSKPAGASHLNLTAGALVTLGGAMGYAKKKSIPSLAAGVAFGAMYMGSAYLINNGKVKDGFKVGMVGSALLFAAMAPRAIKSKAFMPAGLIATIAGTALVYNGYQWNEWR